MLQCIKLPVTVFFFSVLLQQGRAMFFCQVQRSKPPLLPFMTLHEFLLRTDFTFQVLWQCVPYSPLLTTSSDPVLSVYFWDQTVFWSGGLALPSFVRGWRWKRNTGWLLVAPADGGRHRVFLAPFPSSPNSPNSDADQRKWKGCSQLALSALWIIENAFARLFALFLSSFMFQLFCSFPLQPLPLNLASLCWSWDIPSIFWHLRANIIEL